MLWCCGVVEVKWEGNCKLDVLNSMCKGLRSEELSIGSKDSVGGLDIYIFCWGMVGM